MRVVLAAWLWCLCALLHAQTPPMMLAGSWRDGADVSAYWVSEKYDGVRARWDGQTLSTRSGHRIDAPAWFTAHWPDTPLDGELWLGRGTFERTQAVVARGRSDARWQHVQFMVFDLPAHPGSFEQRLQRLNALLPTAGVAWLRPAPQRRLANTAQLQRYLQQVVDGGGEGLMLHHAGNRYRAGRTDGLLKLKPYTDAEATVVGYVPGKGKYTGHVRALLVRASDGRQFRLGSGLSDHDRAHPPPLGAQVTYRYNGHTAAGTPRFARYLRLRHTPPAR